MNNIDSSLSALKDALGPGGWLSEPADTAAYTSDIRGIYKGQTSMVVRPSTTEEVAQVVRLCNTAGIAVVPVGGNTGLCGGAAPMGEAPNIVLSLSRMNRIREVDDNNFTMTVEAGCILENIQNAALEHDMMFPLSLAAEGSCQIGGNISTNAGGLQVVRYGNTRAQILGLEVVLPDGRVWNGLRALRKDNTGYDLKQLFIGAEGTLGVITAATLRLFPKSRSRATAFVALRSSEDVIRLYRLVQGASDGLLTSFEFLPRSAIDLVDSQLGGVPQPFAQPHPWYVIMELESTSPADHVHSLMEAALSQAMEAGLVADASLASNERQADLLWKVREDMFEAQQRQGTPSLKHDISVPISSIPAFLKEADAALRARLPQVQSMGFGHCGDGNVHYNLYVNDERDFESFVAMAPELHAIVYDVTLKYNGSISAEHGIGLSKRSEFLRTKDPLELEIMRGIKRTLDPGDIMNPGKLL